MHTFFSTKNKKGLMAPKEAVILFFGALILVMTFWFLFKLYSVSLAGSDEGSIANLDRLSGEIKKLMESQYYADYKVINYFIGGDKILYGFDYDWDDSPVDTYRPQYKPSKCAYSACLCLYEKDGFSNQADRRDDGVIDCRSDGLHGEKVTLIADFLIVSGSIQQLYVEKIFDESDETYNIFISIIHTDDVNDISNMRLKTIDSGDKGAILGLVGQTSIDTTLATTLETLVVDETGQEMTFADFIVDGIEELYAGPSDFTEFGEKIESVAVFVRRTEFPDNPIEGNVYVVGRLIIREGNTEHPICFYDRYNAGRCESLRDVASIVELQTQVWPGIIEVIIG